MPDVVVISGAEAYADEWHRFPETSRRLAEIISLLGCSVEVAEDVESRLADPGPCRLLVVNIGNPTQPRPADRIAAARRGLRVFLGTGGALLAVHSSATSLTELPGWPAILGGRWVHGVSMHPPKSLAQIRLTGADHPITGGLEDFTVDDERYSYLETASDITVLYEHEHDDLRHPLVWARQDDDSRVVYDALGHDAASYDSPGRVALLRRSVRWLLREL